MSYDVIYQLIRRLNSGFFANPSEPFCVLKKTRGRLGVCHYVVSLQRNRNEHARDVSVSEHKVCDRCSPSYRHSKILRTERFARDQRSHEKDVKLRFRHLTGTRFSLYHEISVLTLAQRAWE